MLDIKHLLRLKKQGYKNRRISGLLSIHRNTVNTYVRIFEDSGKSYEELLGLPESEVFLLLHPTPPVASHSRYEALSSLFPKLEKDLQKVGATYQSLWEDYLRDHPEGYLCSQFKLHLKSYLKRTTVSLRWEHKFGEKLFIDFTGKKLPVLDKLSGEVRWMEVFVAILGASQYTYVEAVEDQSLDSFLETVQNALYYFGGVPCALVPDNLKSAVTKADRYEPEVNRNFKSLGLHYNTVILPTRAYKAKDKALVEGAVRLTYQRIFYPLNELQFFTLADLNTAILPLLDAHNRRPFQAKEYSRASLFEEQEKATLSPLPCTRYERRQYAEGEVNKDAHAWFGPDKHYYSVPYRYVGKRILIQSTHQMLEIYLSATHERIALHQRCSGKPGGFSTQKEHMPPNVRFIKDWSIGQFEKQAAQTDPFLVRFFQKIFEHKAHPEQACKACMGILSLRKAFAAERLIKACQRADYFKNYAYQAVKSILEKNLDQVNWLPDAPSDEAKDLDENHLNIRGPAYYE